MGGEQQQWIQALLRESYFGPCDIHGSARKNERNVFCAHCCLAICQHCTPLHAKHPLLQVRRYVYHDVIRLSDIERWVNCEHVQAYIVNSAKVVFLNQRPHSKPAKGIVNACETCDRILQDGWRFCSLACKLDAYFRKGVTGTGMIKSTISASIRHCRKHGDDEHLSSNCVFPDLTSSSVSPSSSVSTANDDGSPLSPHALLPLGCGLVKSSDPKLVRKMHTSRLYGHTERNQSPSSSPILSSSIQSLISSSSQGALKWARASKWALNSNFAKYMPFTSHDASLSAMEINSLDDSAAYSFSSNTAVLPNVSICSQYARRFPPSKRRKSTPHRSPVC
ncbi:hypothetical protein KP509_13G040100 [Ceratopteris richardii]|uniref:B box-type domain-containing protein n=1 Tax=Ceratopteris richardii TaxID=49495 RepID=A0A8T2TEU6_CERRI|nr:hypothetical protein KP509_13G040100 [Ceratopteris richardii]